MKGKEAQFAIKVHAVKSKMMPKLDDEFVKDISEFNTVDEYRKDVEAKLKKDAEARAERKLEDDILDKIVKSTKIDIPKAMLDYEVEEMIEEFSYRLRYQGLKLEDYLKYMNITMDALKSEYETQASERIKTRLCLEEIIKLEKITYSNDDLNNKLNEYAASTGKDPEKVKLNFKKEQIDYFANMIKQEKLFEFLKKENIQKKEAKPKEEAPKA